MVNVMRDVLAGGVALVALVAAGPAVAQAPIKIGSFLSVTGPASFLGDPEDKTLKQYVEKINASGGILGRKVELIVYDDGGDANQARTFATRLIENDKVDVLIGGTTTGTTMAVAPTVEEEKIPFVSLAGAVVIVEPVKRFVFKTPHTDRMACEKVFDDMKKRGIARIGLISGTDAFGASMAKECKGTIAKYGIAVAADETYGPRDTDMTPQLTNIRNAAGVQAVLVAGFGQGPAIVTRNYKQLGIQVPLYHGHGVASESFIQLAGDAAEGVRLPAAALLVASKLPDGDAQKPVVVGYAKEFTERWKQPVSTFGGHAYDALYIVVEAIKRAGSTDKAKLRDEIEKTKGFIGTGGAFNMSATDHMGLDLTAFRMLQIKGGTWALLD